MVSSNEGWAVGTQSGSPQAGIILHYTNTGGVGTWATFPAPSTPASIPGLNSVFMLSQNEGWAVGKNATILHYTVSGGIGTWNLVTVSGSPGLSTDASLNSIFMLSPTSGFAVGGISVPGFTDGPVIIYWDGTKWTPIATPTIPGGITATGHTSGILTSVFFTGPNDGWAVGYPVILMANILHWDGYSWSHVTLSPALARRDSTNTHISLHDIAQQWLDRGSLTRFPARQPAMHPVTWQLLQWPGLQTTPVYNAEIRTVWRHFLHDYDRYVSVNNFNFYGCNRFNDNGHNDDFIGAARCRHNFYQSSRQSGQPGAGSKCHYPLSGSTRRNERSGHRDFLDSTWDIFGHCR